MGASQKDRDAGLSPLFQPRVPRHPDQVEQRIQRYLAPFDDQLLAELGLSASRAVEICRWIIAKLQSSIDALTETAGREQRARFDLLDQMEREGWDLERLRSEAQHPNYRDLTFELLTGIAQLSYRYISLAELTEHFGSDSATAFWSLFSVARGQVGELTYPTEANLAEQRPSIGLTIIELCVRWRTNSS